MVSTSSKYFVLLPRVFTCTHLLPISHLIVPYMDKIIIDILQISKQIRRLLPIFKIHMSHDIYLEDTYVGFTNTMLFSSFINHNSICFSSPVYAKTLLVDLKLEKWGSVHMNLQSLLYAFVYHICGTFPWNSLTWLSTLTILCLKTSVESTFGIFWGLIYIYSSKTNVKYVS